MDISVSDVKTLREQTGAGIMDCKKALAEAEGDMVEPRTLAFDDVDSEPPSSCPMGQNQSCMARSGCIAGHKLPCITRSTRSKRDQC